MKKLSLILAGLATTMAFTSCDESKDDHPVLNPNDGVIVENFLNIPEMTNTSVDITDANKTNKFHMTCSQPSYGYAASAAYTVEVSLSEDFTTPVVEGCPAMEALATQFYDCSEVNPSYAEVATAMSNILGIKGNDQIPTAYYDVYVRLTANVAAVGGAVYPNTTYQSNVVKLTKARVEYLAIIIPDLPTGIYLRGDMNNWGDGEGDLDGWEFMTTDAAGVYCIESASIPEGTEFKVADATWSSINYGLGSDPFEIGKAYILNGPDNPGNLTMPKNFTGRVTLTVKGATYTILFDPAEPDTPDQPTGVYLRGGMNNWGNGAGDLDGWEFKTSDVKNIWYVKNVTIAAGTEFKVADADWGSVNYGGSEGDIVIGKAYLLGTGANMVCPEAFTGDVQYKVQGGKAYITLMPAAAE